MKFAALLLLAALPVANAVEFDNHCHDAQTQSAWDRLVRQSPGDHELRYLRELRNSICLKIDSGELSIQDGVRQFEMQRQRVVAQRLPAA